MPGKSEPFEARMKMMRIYSDTLNALIKGEGGAMEVRACISTLKEKVSDAVAGV